MPWDKPHTTDVEVIGGRDSKLVGRSPSVRARCACGWVGQARSDEADAQREAAWHVGESDGPDEANLAAERLDAILEGLDVSVDVSGDGYVVLHLAPDVAARLSLDDAGSDTERMDAIGE